MKTVRGSSTEVLVRTFNAHLSLTGDQRIAAQATRAELMWRSDTFTLRDRMQFFRAWFLRLLFPNASFRGLSQR